MKKIHVVILAYVLLVMIALPCYSQNKDEDLAGIYKNYFKLLINNDFNGAWDVLADESKVVLSEVIAKEAEATPDEVLTLLKRNENGLRDRYFGAFRESMGELLNEIYGQGTYKLKSKKGNHATVTIEVQQDPKDFTMIKQDGKWKVNFFKDLMEVR
ncbi:MAG: hypothetical protein ABFD12_06190 [Syntrophorhabdus sp.]